MNDQQSTQKTLKTGAANLQRGAETVGGHLTLTATQLSFVPHSLNIQTEPVKIALQSIKKISLGSTMFLNVIPLFPNALIVEIDGVGYRFTVFARKKWEAAIRNTLNNLPASLIS